MGSSDLHSTSWIWKGVMRQVLECVERRILTDTYQIAEWLEAQPQSQSVGGTK